MIQFQCQGCRHERTEEDTAGARRGFCLHCVAIGKNLKPILEVRKWQARDGSLHDSADQAAAHTLFVELRTAIAVHNRNSGDADNSARHLLSHFNLTRKGEREPLPIPPTTEPARVKHRSWVMFVIPLAAAFAIGFACRGSFPL
ncbi:hypothetical protein [Pseudomonas graminis]|uniref:Uncharacterized protein n=1 Tax=Pseudomonas graminis TaxID=158627 RepID=A0A1C2DY52_9PSED|nr:hypothetical protein [Pseudomonas graminis]OCX19586.1 hypothetical protein BBI10_14405 [Pseudomonas graminis]